MNFNYFNYFSALLLLLNLNPAQAMQKQPSHALVRASSLTTPRLAQTRAFSTNLTRTALLKTPGTHLPTASRLLFKQPQRTILSPTLFKGTYDILPEKHKNLSPLLGAAAYASGLAQNMHQFGNPEDGPHKLSHSLFNVIEASNTFRTTPLPSQPASALTPRQIGEVLGALSAQKLTEQEKITLIKKHAPQANSKEIKKLVKAYNLSIAQEQAGDGQLYVENTAKTQLLTLVHLKSSNKQDILDYFKGLSTYIPEIEFDEQTKQKFLLDNHTPEEIARYHEKMHNVPENVMPIVAEQDTMQKALHSDPELVFAETIKAVNNDTQLPPQVRQGSHGYNGQPARPDCVEAMLRELFNILLNNPETKTFDFSMLPETIKPRQELVDYYIQNPQPLEKNTGQAWMNLVSGHQDIGITYNNNGDYELMPTVPNVFKLINYFFNLNVKSCEELTEALSDSRRTITFKASNDITQNQNNNCIQVMMHTKTSTIPFALKIMPGHGYLERPNEQAKNNYFKKFNIYNILNQDQKIKQPLQYAITPFSDALIYSYSCPGRESSTILPQTMPLLAPFAHLIVLSTAHKDANFRLDLAKKLLMNYKNNYKNAPKHRQEKFLNIVARMIQKLPNDEHFTENICDYLLSNNLQGLPEFKNIFNKLSTDKMIHLGLFERANWQRGQRSPEALKFLYNEILKKLDIDELDRQNPNCGVFDLSELFLDTFIVLDRDSDRDATIMQILNECVEKLPRITPHGIRPFDKLTETIIKNNLANQHPVFNKILNRCNFGKNFIKQINSEFELFEAYKNGNHALVLKLIEEEALPDEGERYYFKNLKYQPDRMESFLLSFLDNDNISLLELYIQQKKGVNFVIVNRCLTDEKKFQTPLCHARSKEAIDLLLAGGAKWYYQRKDITVNAFDHLPADLAAYLETKIDPIPALNYNT